MSLDFGEHDLHEGAVLGVGVCEYAPVPLRPLSIPVSIVDYLDNDPSVEDRRVDGTRFGDPSSTMRTMGSCQWMLGDAEKLCSFVGPPDFHPNEESLEDKARFQNTIYMCEDSGINLHSLHDEYVFDPSDHRGTRGLYLSSSKDAIHPSSPQNNRTVDLREEDGEQKYAYNDKDVIGKGYIRERYTDTRLIEHEDIMKHQRHSRSKFFTDCLEGDNAEVAGMVEKAGYVVIGSSALSIGRRRYDGGRFPSAGSDDTAGKAQAKNGDEAEALDDGEGGLPALVPLLEQCLTHNKAVVVTFTGATLVPNMRADFMMLLQYTDFLFITERECRRAAILLLDIPDMDLRASARALSTFTKISDKRSRVVVVLPNAPLPVYPAPPRRIPEERLQLEAQGAGYREKYDAEGRPAFDRFIDLDSRCHDNDQELRTLIDPDLPVDGLPGFSTSLASVSELLGPGTHAGSVGATERNLSPDGGPVDPQMPTLSLHSAAVLVMCLGEELRVPVQWPEPDEATGMAKDLLKALGLRPEDEDDDLSAFSDLFYQGAHAGQSSPSATSFTSMHSFYYNQAGAAFLPRRPFRSEIPDGMQTPKRLLSAASKDEGGPLPVGTRGEKGDGDGDGKEFHMDSTGNQEEEREQRQEAYRKGVVASQAAHTAQCDIFSGAFLALVVRAEAAINAAHQRLLSEQAAKSFVRETVPDVRGLETAAARSIRLKQEREKAGISDGEHRLRLQTAALSTKQGSGASRQGPSSSKTATGKHSRRRGSDRKEVDTRMNRGDKRRSLTDTKRQSLFQGPESRMRNSDLTTMVEVDASKKSLYSDSEGNGGSDGVGEEEGQGGEHKLSVRAMGVSSWGDNDNAQNEYSGAGIKWEDAPLSAAQNVVTGKRIFYDCVGAGCYALANYQPPTHNVKGRDGRVVSPLSSPAAAAAAGLDSKGRPESPALLAPGTASSGDVSIPGSIPRSPGSRLGTTRKPLARPPCGFWRNNTGSLEAAIEAAAAASLSGTSVVSNASSLRGMDEGTLSLHDNDYGAASVTSNFSDSSKSSHWSSRRRLHQLL